MLAAACWTALTVATAIASGAGHGAVFVVSLVLGTMLLGLVALLVRIVRDAR